LLLLLAAPADAAAIRPMTSPMTKVGMKMMTASMMYATRRIQKPPYVTCP